MISTSVIRSSGLASKEADFARDVAEIIEFVAIAAIVATIVLAVAVAVRARLQGDASDSLRAFKHAFARGLLVGLDLLIAADIIKSVTIEATLENVSALGILVLVRTFLSWSLIVETEARWPWQRPRPRDELELLDE